MSVFPFTTSSHIVLSAFSIAVVITLLLSLPWYNICYLFFLLRFIVLFIAFAFYIFQILLYKSKGRFMLRKLLYPLYKQLLRRSFFFTTLINTFCCTRPFTGLWCFIRMLSGYSDPFNIWMEHFHMYFILVIHIFYTCLTYAIYFSWWACLLSVILRSIADTFALHSIQIIYASNII